jgi:quercetin dioxygenase-like cupin family protein
LAHAGQELRGPGGFRLRLVATGTETGGDVLEMEATYTGTGQLPPEHLHPRQVERFEVLEGSVRAIVAGSESRYSPGEAFEVPAGTPHQMTAEEPARMRWEVRPAMRTAEFFERLYAMLAGEGEDASLADLLEEFSEEVRMTGS